jgi:hypothetical protein
VLDQFRRRYIEDTATTHDQADAHFFLVAVLAFGLVLFSALESAVPALKRAAFLAAILSSLAGLPDLQ